MTQRRVYVRRCGRAICYGITGVLRELLKDQETKGPLYRNQVIQKTSLKGQKPPLLPKDHPLTTTSVEEEEPFPEDNTNDMDICGRLGTTQQQLQHLYRILKKNLPVYRNHSYPYTLKCQVSVRFMAMGGVLLDLNSYFVELSKDRIYAFTVRVCEAICDTMGDYIMLPEKEDWLEIQDQFKTRYKLPFCCGVLDGKRITTTRSFNSSQYYLKGTKVYGIAILALVDANYNFRYVHVDSDSSQYSTKFPECSFLESLRNGTLGLPINGAFIIDDEFPVQPRIMKPYQETENMTPEQRAFNDRIAPVCNVAENAFGILTTKFGVYHYSMTLKRSTIESIIKATCILHNWLLQTAPGYCPQGYVDEVVDGQIVPGAWRSVRSEGVQDVDVILSTDVDSEANAVRDTVAAYFLSELYE